MVLGIYGSSGVGREVKEIADLQGCWSEIVFIDDTLQADTFKGIKRMPYMQFVKLYNPSRAKVIIAVGEPEDKKNLYNKVKADGYELANVIHPQSHISRDAKLGNGIIAQVGSVIAVDAIVGDNVTLEQYAIVSHDSIIENHVQLSAFVMLAGSCSVGETTYIGIGALIKEKIVIGHDVIVGMGALVLKNIPDNMIAVGNPVRTLKLRNGKRVFK